MATFSPEYQYSVNKVLEFEAELDHKMHNLPDIEKDILLVGNQRREWLDNITITDQSESQIYSKRIDVIKAQMELSNLQMIADILKLEGFYETQSLNYLIEATKPSDTYQHEGDREKELAAIARKDSQALVDALLSSMDFRAKLGNFNYDMIQTVNKLRLAAEHEQIAKREEVLEKLLEYNETMRDSVENGKKVHKKVTAEYLVLRHNARVAKEILIRSQNEAHLARTELQKRLDQIQREVAMEHEKIEVSSKHEIKVLTNEIRSEVMAKEVELESLTDRVSHLKDAKKNNFRNLKKEIRVMVKKYNELVSTRRRDIETITEELSKIRKQIDTIQYKLSLHSQRILDDAGSLLSSDTSSSGKGSAGSSPPAYLKSMNKFNSLLGEVYEKENVKIVQKLKEKLVIMELNAGKKRDKVKADRSALNTSKNSGGSRPLSARPVNAAVAAPSTATRRVSAPATATAVSSIKKNVSGSGKATASAQKSPLSFSQDVTKKF